MLRGIVYISDHRIYDGVGIFRQYCRVSLYRAETADRFPYSEYRAVSFRDLRHPLFSFLRNRGKIFRHGIYISQSFFIRFLPIFTSPKNTYANTPRMGRDNMTTIQATLDAGCLCGRVRIRMMNNICIARAAAVTMRG